RDRAAPRDPRRGDRAHRGVRARPPRARRAHVQPLRRDQAPGVGGLPRPGHPLGAGQVPSRPVTDVRSLLRFGGDLSAIDTRATPGVKSRKKAEAAFAAESAELAELQERVNAEGTRAVVLLLQGMDTCG